MLLYRCMKNIITALGKAVLNLVYPLTCHICDTKLTENKGLCESCASKIHKNNYGLAACEYEGVLKETVCLFKYRRTLSLLNTFSGLLIEFINLFPANLPKIIPYNNTYYKSKPNYTLILQR